jgi:hypothetical protein
MGSGEDPMTGPREQDNEHLDYSRVRLFQFGSVSDF